jgi:hypothetical protein
MAIRLSSPTCALLLWLKVGGNAGHAFGELIAFKKENRGLSDGGQRRLRAN